MLAIVFIMTNMVVKNYCNAQAVERVINGTQKKAPNNSSAIIGNSIKFRNLEIVQFNFPKQMTWDDANIACAKLGDGWRLPTIEELKIIYKIKDRIDGFENSYPWSSTLDEKGYGKDYAFLLSGGESDTKAKTITAGVRAVRSY